MYSPPRMCTAAKKLRFKADFSLDLTVNNEDCEPQDLSLDHGQRKALRKCEQEKPWLLMASPPCTSFNVLPNLFLDKQDEGEFQAEIDSAIEHTLPSRCLSARSNLPRGGCSHWNTQPRHRHA